MQHRATEVSDIIRNTLHHADKAFDSYEVGTVLSVGDGIARI